MKILILTKSILNPFNRRLHFEFLQRLKKWVDVEVCEVIRDNKGPVIVGKKKGKDLYYDYKPDVILMHFHNQLLDGFLKGIPCLKVMIAVDLYKYSDFEWHRNNEFDLIAHRGFYPDKIPIPSVWLPFAADQNEFKPNPLVGRKKRVGFVGNYLSPIYKVRRRALELLDAEGDLLEWHKDLLLGVKYTSFMRSTELGLHTSPIFTPHAKLFEFIASGTVVITNEFGGERNLFGEDSFIKFKDNCSDLIGEVKGALGDLDLIDEKAERAYDIFLEKHTTERRVLELYGHLKNLSEGKETENKWM